MLTGSVFITDEEFEDHIGAASAFGGEGDRRMNLPRRFQIGRQRHP